MNSITDLFCTPEQGQRLVELVQGLECNLRWLKFEFSEGFQKLPYFNEAHLDEMYAESAPALTLQELRDLYERLELGHRAEFYGALSSETAPDLAAWVIERLEATP